MKENKNVDRQKILQLSSVYLIKNIMIEVQRGHLKKAIKMFENAIPLANTKLEMGHLYGLRDAAIAQTTVSTRLGISLPGMLG